MMKVVDAADTEDPFTISQRFNSSVGDFGQLASARVTALTADTSRDFADRSNAIILKAQDDLNQHVFGWINTTTGTINATLNEFVDGIAAAVNDTFAGTPLFTPVQSFVSCILLQKVLKLEEALNWLHDNAHADFPLVAPTVLTLDANRSQELLQPVQETATGNQDGQGGLIDKLVKSYKDKLSQERNLFFIFLGLYGVVIIVGTLVAILYKRASQDEGEGRSRRGGSAEDEGYGDYKGDWPSNGIANPHHSITAPISPDRMVLHVRAPLPFEETGTAVPRAAKSSSRAMQATDEPWRVSFANSASPMLDFAKAHDGWQEKKREMLQVRTLPSQNFSTYSTESGQDSSAEARWVPRQLQLAPTTKGGPGYLNENHSSERQASDSLSARYCGVSCSRTESKPFSPTSLSSNFVLVLPSPS